MGLKEYYKTKKLQRELDREARHQELLKDAEKAKERTKYYREEAAARKAISEARKERWKQSLPGRAASGLERFSNKMSKTKISVRTPKYSRKKQETDIFGNVFSTGGSSSNPLFADIGLFPEERRPKKRKKRRK